MKKTELLDEELNEINGGASLKQETQSTAAYGSVRDVANGASPLQQVRFGKEALNSEVNRQARFTNSRFVQGLVGLPLIGTFVVRFLDAKEN